MSTRDHARFGYLFLRNGNWNGKQLISPDWIGAIRKPCEANAEYGYMWWLNPGRKKFPDAPDSCFYASGFGGDFIVVDQEHDLLIVVRWTPDIAGIVHRVIKSIIPE